MLRTAALVSSKQCRCLSARRRGRALLAGQMCEWSRGRWRTRRAWAVWEEWRTTNMVSMGMSWLVYTVVVSGPRRRASDVVMTTSSCFEEQKERFDWGEHRGNQIREVDAGPSRGYGNSKMLNLFIFLTLLCFWFANVTPLLKERLQGGCIFFDI